MYSDNLFSFLVKDSSYPPLTSLLLEVLVPCFSWSSNLLTLLIIWILQDVYSCSSLGIDSSLDWVELGFSHSTGFWLLSLSLPDTQYPLAAGFLSLPGWLPFLRVLVHHPYLSALLFSVFSHIFWILKSPPLVTEWFSKEGGGGSVIWTLRQKIPPLVVIHNRRCQ